MQTKKLYMQLSTQNISSYSNLATYTRLRIPNNHAFVNNKTHTTVYAYMYCSLFICYYNFVGCTPSLIFHTHTHTTRIYHPPTHSLIHPPTHPLTHSPTHPLTHSPTHPLTHPPTHTYSLTHSLAQTHTHPLTHSLTRSDTYTPTSLQYTKKAGIELIARHAYQYDVYGDSGGMI